MNELLKEEKLTTADIANPPRRDAVASVGTGADVETRYGQAAGVNAQIMEPNPLFANEELNNFRSRWDQVQASFVDEPRAAVEHADSLVANVVKRIAEQFASEREQLEKQWDQGDNVNTEDLRQAFKRYRAFFDRLLSV
jgi:ornithine carbamoyltransferase